ncbi:MAG: hypothetical protein AAGK97_07165, partial [Bacteroidota bacterium]
MRNFKTILNKLIGTFCFVFALAIGIQAQTFLNLNSISVSKSYEQEILRGLNAKTITDQVRGNLNFDYDAMEFEKTDIYSMYCENPNLRIGGTLPLKKTGMDLYLGASFIWDRYDAANYRAGDSELRFESWTNELKMDNSTFFNNAASTDNSF